MAQTSRTVNLARSTVNCRCHVCAFFNSRDDEYKVMLPFIKEGFDLGDRAVYILDQNQRSERLQRLAETGVDTSKRSAQSAPLGECLPAAWRVRSVRDDRSARRGCEGCNAARARNDPAMGQHGMGAAGFSW